MKRNRHLHSACRAVSLSLATTGLARATKHVVAFLLWLLKDVAYDLILSTQSTSPPRPVSWPQTDSVEKLD